MYFLQENLSKDDVKRMVVPGECQPPQRPSAVAFTLFLYRPRRVHLFMPNAVEPRACFDINIHSTKRTLLHRSRCFYFMSIVEPLFSSATDLRIALRARGLTPAGSRESMQGALYHQAPLAMLCPASACLKHMHRPLAPSFHILAPYSDALTQSYDLVPAARLVEYLEAVAAGVIPAACMAESYDQPSTAPFEEQSRGVNNNYARSEGQARASIPSHPSFLLSIP